MFIRLKFKDSDAALNGLDVNIAVEKITVFATASKQDHEEAASGSIVSFDNGTQISVQESTRVIRTLIAKAEAASFETYSNAGVDLGESAVNEATTQN